MKRPALMRAAIGTAALAPILGRAFNASQRYHEEDLMNAYTDPSRVITASLDEFLEKKAGLYSMTKTAARGGPSMPPALKKMMTDERRRSTRALSAAVGRRMNQGSGLSGIGESLLEGVGKGVGSSAGGVIVSLLANAIGAGIGALHDKFSTDPKRQALVASLLRTDPVLSDAVKRHPEAKRMVEESYGTMVRFAPTLSMDPNAVRSFLREAVLGGSGVNYATIKNLVDTERSIADSKPQYGRK